MLREPRLLAPAGLLLIGCIGLMKSHSQRGLPLAAPIATASPAIEGYSVTDLKLSKEEIGVAGMTDYVARAYSRDSTGAFSTLVSYYDRQTQGRTIHSPRNCLPGAGWEILAPGVRTLASPTGEETVNRYVLKNSEATAVVYYWYQGRGRVVANEYVVKWNLLRDAALKGHTEEALVRVVVPVSRATGGAGRSEEAAIAAADSIGVRVATMLLSTVDKVLPKS
jgi:EpsI family protein